MYYSGMACGDNQMASLEQGVAAFSFMGYLGKTAKKLPNPKPAKVTKSSKKTSGMMTYACTGTGYSINCDTVSPVSCDQQCSQYINNLQPVIMPASVSPMSAPVSTPVINPNSDQVQSGIQAVLTMYETTPKVITPQVLPGSLPVQGVAPYVNPAQSGSNYYIPATPAYMSGLGEFSKPMLIGAALLAAWLLLRKK